MNRPVFCLLVSLMVTACASPGFTTTSSGPRKEQAPEVVVVEPDAGEVRAAQLRKQEKEINDLRDEIDASRGRAEAAARRSDVASRKALAAVEAMESQLADLSSRTDAAAAQADRSFALAKEFLSSIVAAREEQSAMVQRNTARFDRMAERLDAIDGRISEVRKSGQAELATAQSRSSTMEQSLKNTDLQLLALSEQIQAANRNRDESRKRSQAELAAVRTRSSEMEQKLKTAEQQLQATDQRLKRTEQKLKEADQKLLELYAQLQQSNRNSETARKLSESQMAATIARSADMEQKLNGTDKQLSDMREELLLLNRNVEQTQAAMGSGPMLEMMRRLESTQRETSGLRGLIEELQQEQQVARKRMQDYYLDLDARIQDLQKRERAAREAAEARRRDAEENATLPPLGDVEIPATMDFDSEEMDGAKSSGAESSGAERSSAERIGTADTERSASDVRGQPNQIEAMPLPEEVSPASSFDSQR
jgi:myosin heavy subunit